MTAPTLESIRAAEQRLAAAESAAMIRRPGSDLEQLRAAVAAARTEVLALRRAARAAA